MERRLLRAKAKKQVWPRAPSFVGRQAHHTDNVRRDIISPVRPYNHVEARVRAILQPELANLVDASVVYRKRSKAITEVGHLQNNGLRPKAEIIQPVDHVLVWVGNEFLGGIGVIAQHRQQDDGATPTPLSSKRASGGLVSWFRWLNTWTSGHPQM
jgi:hypothetical protein